MADAQGSKQALRQPPGKSQVVKNGSLWKKVKGSRGTLKPGGLPTAMLKGKSGN